MLFVDINYFKDSIREVSPQKSAELRSQTWAYLDKHLKAGTLKEIFWFADGNGAISIWDFASAEDMYSVVNAAPAFAYFTTEVIPLVDYEGLSKISKQREAERKAAAK
jgi:muconolactone delta-isomerase